MPWPQASTAAGKGRNRMFDATFWAFVALVVFLGIVLYMRVPGMITKALDTRAEGIEKELDEARRLREEAQEVLAEYQRKTQNAEREAEDIIAQAKAEAERLTEATNQALSELIERRTKAAELKIAQAEAQARADVQAAAADVAIRAAEMILAKKTAGTAGDDLVADGIKEVRAKLK